MPALNGKQFKPSGEEQASRLQNTWMHGRGDHMAVLWTKGGVRHEGDRVSPVQGGVVLHGGAKAQTFKNEHVNEVHYRPRG